MPRIDAIMIIDHGVERVFLFMQKLAPTHSNKKLSQNASGLQGGLHLELG